MKKSSYLQKPRIFPKIPKTSNTDVLDLMNYYAASGAYNGGSM
jgi:hypothetical protein